MVHSWCIFMSIDVWAKWSFLLMYMSHDIDIGTCCILGRAPRTNETLPDFREWCQVTRRPRVFRRLTGCQRTPRFWDVTSALDVNGSDVV